MATNAEHQAAWRQRRKAELAALRKDDTELDLLAVQIEQTIKERDQILLALRKECKQLRAENAALRKECKVLRAEALRQGDNAAALRKECEQLRTQHRRLDPQWYGKFCKRVGLLGSDNVGERHNAADAAFRMLAEAGLRWSDIV